MNWFGDDFFQESSTFLCTIFGVEVEWKYKSLLILSNVKLIEYFDSAGICLFSFDEFLESINHIFSFWGWGWG